LFTQDPGFWQTVHLGGDGYEEYLAQQAAAARAEWADKVVVKDVHFHGLPGTGDKAAAQVCLDGKLLEWTTGFVCFFLGDDVGVASTCFDRLCKFRGVRHAICCR
jgi:hypothetical protein